jgi:hypothetical protein
MGYLWPVPFGDISTAFEAPEFYWAIFSLAHFDLRGKTGPTALSLKQELAIKA